MGPYAPPYPRRLARRLVRTVSTGACHREPVVKRKPSAERHRIADILKPYEQGLALLTP